ncbi:hypothetical protein [Planomonospora sp. ID82291]|uniref:hypothetical protein n=1 Tax=Planomonospora sp. ID82291 TaxID=2738136 RepID=UPI0018C3DC98|nr:hypothetical protein [Planomonospora sp. ID82291]MBG0815612.1 hypothetical protein [Planomonospora sp. ID82291]
MNDGQGDLGGHRLTGRTWLGELGTWYSAVAPGGRPASALRFDARPFADPAARDRLVAAVLADRGLLQGGLTGLVPVADLITAGGEVWLLTGEPADPTVTDLLARPPGGLRPGADEAATVLAETAQTLLSVHAAGLAHGAVHPGTVVIAPDGSVLLAERGLSDALHGRPAAPDRDVAAWASLTRGLAANWAASAPRTAELFERVAATAVTHGLAAARDALLAGRDLLPPGFPACDRLAETAHRWSLQDEPAPVTHPAPVPADRDAEEAVTLLQVPEGGGGRAGSVRFGPGVPVETVAAQIWREGRSGQATVLGAGAQRASRPSRPPARRYRTAASAVILALMAAAAVLVWLLRAPSAPLAVTGVEVLAPKRTQQCGETVTIRGVLTTNGSPGEVRYRWRQSDKEEPIEHVLRPAAGKTEHVVSLRWRVKGEGSFRGTATLEVVSPVPDGAKISDRASITYRC